MPEGKKQRAARKSSAAKRKAPRSKTATGNAPKKKRQKTQAEIHPEIPANLYAALRLGATRTAACSHAGITSQTFRNWERRAEDGEEFFVDLFDKIEAAENQLQLRCLQAIHLAMPIDKTEKVKMKNGKEVEVPVPFAVRNAAAQNAKWLLNNKFSNFKPRSVVEHTGPEVGDLFLGRTDEELEYWKLHHHFPEEAPE